MNDKCKYCDYVSKCSRNCEYDSILCRIKRSFPKVVDKSYEQLQQENKQLKIQISAREEVCNRLESNWNKLKEWASNFYNSEEVGWAGCGIRYTLEKMQELEGSDSNEI